MTSTREPLPTIKILNETYTTVKPLLLYLVDVLELDFFVPPSDTDPLAFRILFDNTFIATNKVTEAKLQHKEAPGGMGDVCILSPYLKTGLTICCVRLSKKRK